MNLMMNGTGEGIGKIQLNLAHSNSLFELQLAILTLEDEQIVWTDKSSCICMSDVNLCRAVVNLFFSTG